MFMLLPKAHWRDSSVRSSAFHESRKVLRKAVSLEVTASGSALDPWTVKTPWHLMQLEMMNQVQQMTRMSAVMMIGSQDKMSRSTTRIFLKY